MAINTVSSFTLFASYLVAAVLELIAIPNTVAFLRPEWMVLTFIYWVLRHPEKTGIAMGLTVGLVMDVLSGSYLGIHMLAMTLICYLVLTMRKRLIMFPVSQQALVVFFVVGIQLMVVYLLRSLLEVAPGGLEYLWQAFTSAVIWPVVVILFDRLVYALR